MGWNGIVLDWIGGDGMVAARTEYGGDRVNSAWAVYGGGLFSLGFVGFVKAFASTIAPLIPWHRNSKPHDNLCINRCHCPQSSKSMEPDCFDKVLHRLYGVLARDMLQLPTRCNQEFSLCFETTPIRTLHTRIPLHYSVE